jgi:hypothetical protein
MISPSPSPSPSLGTAPAVPAPRARLNVDRVRALAGIALLIAAAICFCLRLATASHDRAWSADATPRASYDLLLAQQYTLSSAAGPLAIASAPLSCTIQALGGAGGAPGAVQPLALTVLAGDRITHQLATFVAPFSGSARIACASVAVFVDDATGIGRDLGAVLVVAGIGLGTIGLLLASSTVIARRPETPPKCGPVAVGLSQGTTVDAAPGV